VERFDVSPNGQSLAYVAAGSLYLAAADGSDPALMPWLPYILQDIQEIGTSPEIVIELIRRHMTDFSKLKILDLGCGKGAVSIRAAAELDCTCFGIDAIPEFIAEAQSRALELGVAHRCDFEVGDLRTRIATLEPFDVIILGALGPVLGDYFETLTALKSCRKPNGLIIVDDGYFEDNRDDSHPQMQKKSGILAQVAAAGMRLIDEIIIPPDAIKESDAEIFAKLKQRCLELIEKHPTQKELFLDYIRQQEAENAVLEQDVICAVLAIR